MKKILAVILAIIMTFSVALVPVYAADEATAETEVSIDFDALQEQIDTLFAYIIEAIEAIHNLVGDIMGVFDAECAFCETVHVAQAA